MSEYLAAFVTLMSLVSLILKYLLSHEAEIKVKEKKIKVQEKKEQEEIDKEVDSNAALTQGAQKAWDAADENENS